MNPTLILCIASMVVEAALQLIRLMKKQKYIPRKETPDEQQRIS